MDFKTLSWSYKKAYDVNVSSFLQYFPRVSWQKFPLSSLTCCESAVCGDVRVPVTGHGSGSGRQRLSLGWPGPDSGPQIRAASSAWVGRNRKITPIPLMFSTSYTYTSRQCGAGSSGLKGFSSSWILFQSTNSVHFSLDKKCCGCIFSAKYQTFLSFMVKC